MEFSLFYFAAEDGDVGNNGKYRMLLEGSKFADENGFAAVWIPERHFNTFGGRFANPSVAAAAAACVTHRVKIRSGTVILPLHDPIRVAEEWSMVDHLSNGRVELGIGSGWHQNDFVLAPDRYNDRHENMCEMIRVVRELWEGRSCSRMNGRGEKVDISIYPKPLQRTLAIWVSGAGNPRTFQFAGSIGARLITNMVFQPMDQLKRNIAVYYEALKSAGFDRSSGSVALMIHTFVGEEIEAVKRTIRTPLLNYLTYFTGLLAPTQTSVDVSRASAFLAEMAFQRFLARGGLFGSIESCMERLSMLSDMGVSEVACLVDFGVDTDTVLAHLEDLAALRSRYSSSFPTAYATR